MDNAPPASPAKITRLLHEWQSGDRLALDQLIPLVYDELRAIASRHTSREWRPDALQTTALVHEAFLKLVDQRQVDWRNRAHFFGLAAQLMRRILLDDARRQLREKRGGGGPHLAVDDLELATQGDPVDRADVIDIDRALRALEALDPDQGRVVELRFFGGLTVEETAEVMGTSPATVKREWVVAKGWLYRELGRRDGGAW